MWWRDGREREAKWFGYYEVRRNWKLKGGKEQPDRSSLHCHLRLWWCHCPCWYWRSCLGSWACNSRSLSQCPWPILPPKIIPGFVYCLEATLISQCCTELAMPLSSYGTWESWPYPMSTMQWHGDGKAPPHPSRPEQMGELDPALAAVVRESSSKPVEFWSFDMYWDAKFCVSRSSCLKRSEFPCMQSCTNFAP